MAHDEDFTSRLPFTSTDTAYLDARLSGQATRRKPLYDIELTDDDMDYGVTDALVRDAVKLRSRNLGYDFALVKIDGGRSILGAPKDLVKIYIRKSGDRHYYYLDTATGLCRALNMIDRMYEEAAEGHLP